MINLGIKPGDFNEQTYRSMLGDWDIYDPYSTRASDWITNHMTTYHHVTNDDFWLKARTTTFDMIDSIQTHYSPQTGLLPDFVVNTPVQPAPPRFLEAETDGFYSWNACRFPWRMAVDFAHHGNKESQQALNKIMSWVISETNHRPENIVAGYTLSGTPLYEWSSAAFTSPLVAAAIVTGHQEFLNIGWEQMTTSYNSYYPDTINLLTMLLISGNWWDPIAVRNSN